MEIYVEGQKVEKLPCFTRKDKLRSTSSGGMLTSASATERKKPESMRRHAVRLTMGITMTASPPRDSSNKQINYNTE